MRPLKFLGVLTLTVVAHSAMVRMAPGSVEGVDLFLVLIVLNALVGSSLAGLLGGAAAGLARDALSGSVFGLHGFAGTILGYAAARISQRLVVRRGLGVLLLIAAAVPIQAMILLGLSALALPVLLLPNPTWLLLRAGVSGGLGALLFTGVKAWRRGAPVRRQRRSKRLKLK